MVRTYSWKDIVRAVLNLLEHEDLKIMKGVVLHPSKVGFRKAIGEPVGQKADYRLAFPDGRGIHVKEYDHYYLIHWDKKDPKIDPLGHLLEDAPHWLAILGIGGLVGILGAVLVEKFLNGK